MLNVILPCAGEGTRLGLPYPKEMHHVANGMGLIDLSLQRLYPHRDRIARVTITLTPSKADLVRYLGKWRVAFPFAFTYFDERNEEWPGSILSAEALYMARNIVLLPDSLILEEPDRPVVPTFDRLLGEHDLVFGVKREQSERLRSLGAVRCGWRPMAASRRSATSRPRHSIDSTASGDALASRATPAAASSS